MKRFAAECKTIGMRISTSKSEALVLGRKPIAYSGLVVGAAGKDTPWRLLREVFLARPGRKRPWGRPRTRWKNPISILAGEHLLVPQSKLVDVAEEREVWDP